MQGLALKRKFLSYAAPVLMAAGGVACTPGLQQGPAVSAPSTTVVDIPVIENAATAVPEERGPSKAPFVTEDSFDKEVFRSRGFVLLSFTQDDCRACEGFNPQLDAVAEARDDIKVMQVDIASNNAIRAGYDIRKDEGPAVVLFHNGVPVQTHKGAIGRDELSGWVDQGIRRAQDMSKPTLKQLSDAILSGPAVATDANADEAVFGHKGLLLVNICVKGIPACEKVQSRQLAARFAGKLDVIDMPLEQSAETAKRIKGMVAADGDDVVVPGLFMFKDGQLQGRIVPELDFTWWKNARIIEKAIEQINAGSNDNKGPRVSAPQRSVAP